MINKINFSYFQLYARLIVGSSLLDLGFRSYRSRTQNHDSQTKIGLAVSRALQNVSFVLPIIWVGYKGWKVIHVKHDPLVSQLLTAATGVLPLFGFASYLVVGLGLNPVFVALGPPREIKYLREDLTPLICNLFRILNMSALSVLLLTGKVSRPSAFLAIGACLITMVAQHRLEK